MVISTFMGTVKSRKYLKVKSEANFLGDKILSEYFQRNFQGQKVVRIFPTLSEYFQRYPNISCPNISKPPVLAIAYSLLSVIGGYFELTRSEQQFYNPE